MFFFKSINSSVLREPKRSVSIELNKASMPAFFGRKHPYSKAKIVFYQRTVPTHCSQSMNYLFIRITPASAAQERNVHCVGWKMVSESTLKAGYASLTLSIVLSSYVSFMYIFILPS